MKRSLFKTLKKLLFLLLTLALAYSGKAQVSTYISSNVMQTDTTPLYAGSSDIVMLRLMIVRSTGIPIDLTRVDLYTYVSNSFVSLADIKVWYTGNSNLFASTTQFGTTKNYPGTHESIGGTQALLYDTNYFWITCSILGTPTGYYANVECDGIVVDGNFYSLPTVGATPYRRVAINHCTPYNYGGNLITKVQLHTLDYTPSTATNPFYRLFSSRITNTTVLYSATSYTLSVTSNGNSIISVWIDYNNDGSFDASEWTQVCTSSTVNVANNVTLNIPSTALSGYHKMRIRSNLSGNINGSSDACSTFFYGETQDYFIYIAPVAPYFNSVALQLDTTPVFAGSTNNDMFRIQVRRGVGSPPNVSSITIRTTGTTSLADISNMKVWYTGNSTSFTTPTQFGTTLASPSLLNTFTGTQPLLYDTNYFWITCHVTATAIAGNYVDAYCDDIVVNGTSRRPAIPSGNRLIQNAYCIPPPSGGGVANIVNVQFHSIHNSPFTASIPYYRKFSPTDTTTTALIKGTTYPLSVTSNGNAIISTWIDYNNNSLFDSSEWTQVCTTSASYIANTVLITIPATTSSGYHLMRIRSCLMGAPNGAHDACTNFGSGETQDYFIYITGIMPVNLLNIDAAVLHSKDVQLNWATAQEINNKAFVIERSINQQDFVSVATVAGRGTTSSIQTYTFTDKDAFSLAGSDVLYYRLKQIDDDGQAEYSPVVPINRNKTPQTDLTVYPNPFSTSAIFTLSSAEEQQAVACILDLQGKILFTKTLTCAAGINTFMLEDLTSLNNGIYFIRVQLEHEHVPAQIKLVKAE